MTTEIRGRVKPAQLTFFFLLIAVDTVSQTVQQAAEQAKDAGQKALDEVYKVAETGEKAVKNVANQATSWGKSFGQ